MPVVPPVVQDKLVEMEKSVANPDLGSDLRGVKELLKKHQALEMDLGLLADTMQTIVEQGKEMAKAGHFNSAGILSAVEDFNKRWSVGVSCSVVSKLACSWGKLCSVFVCVCVCGGGCAALL